ncbi:helix-turn-helix transcriptional regulator [Dethiothermospora halolimnae]|uniref:helix-turn-helix transcriptional regulator n=1 Tax=Dethiothermospora halolimnae TaxID=3114390 RepID=UPI003CCBD030
MDNEELFTNNIISLIQGVSEIIGKRSEVVLYSKDNPNIIDFISGDNVTKRKVGDKITEFEKEIMDIVNDRKKSILNYKSVVKEGRTIKTSILITKDCEDNILRYIGINTDVTDFIAYRNALDDLLNFTNIDTTTEIKEKNDNVEYILHNIVDETIKDIGIPITYLKKKDKVDIVRKLNNKNLFLIKGSIEYVAKKLLVSRYTIYNYLEEIEKRD